MLYAVMAQAVDFQALTPGRHWEAGTACEIVADIIFGRWFGPGDGIAEMRSIHADRVGEREHVSYRMLVRRADADYLVEQQAYYLAEDGRITWMRILCSGHQPVREEGRAVRLRARDWPRTGASDRSATSRPSRWARRSAIRHQARRRSLITLAAR